MIRDVVSIDEELCDGCGECVPACAEGAIEIVDGVARLVSDTLCDGLGVCLGHCPKGAIKVDRREAQAFDEVAVQERLSGVPGAGHVPRPTNGSRIAGSGLGGAADSAHPSCPSSRFTQLARQPIEAGGEAETDSGTRSTAVASELGHWPVQLRLLPPTAPVLRRARVLVSADCVPVAYADFHAQLLRGHSAVIACPKLDDPRGYIEKLAEMIRHNEPEAITVAHMDVPCCTGILHMVLEARRRAGYGVPVRDIVISTRGQVVAEQEIPADLELCGNDEVPRCPTLGVE